LRLGGHAYIAGPDCHSHDFLIFAIISYLLPITGSTFLRYPIYKQQEKRPKILDGFLTFIQSRLAQASCTSNTGYGRYATCKCTVHTEPPCLWMNSLMDGSSPSSTHLRTTHQKSRAASKQCVDTCLDVLELIDGGAGHAAGGPETVGLQVECLDLVVLDDGGVSLAHQTQGGHICIHSQRLGQLALWIRQHANLRTHHVPSIVHWNHPPRQSLPACAAMSIPGGFACTKS